MIHKLFRPFRARGILIAIDPQGAALGSIILAFQAAHVRLIGGNIRAQGNALGLRTKLRHVP